MIKNTSLWFKSTCHMVKLFKSRNVTDWYSRGPDRLSPGWVGVRTGSSCAPSPTSGCAEAPKDWSLPLPLLNSLFQVQENDYERNQVKVVVKSSSLSASSCIPWIRSLTWPRGQKIFVYYYKRIVKSRQRKVKESSWISNSLVPL